MVGPFGDNPSVSCADSSPFRGAIDVVGGEGVVLKLIQPTPSLQDRLPGQEKTKVEEYDGHNDADKYYFKLFLHREPPEACYTYFYKLNSAYVTLIS